MDRHYRYLFSEKKRSEEHFVFFLAYQVTTLKVIIEFPVIFLLYGRKSAGSFCRTISGTRAHETWENPGNEVKPPAVIFQPRCLSSHEWNHKSDGEFFFRKGEEVAIERHRSRVPVDKDKHTRVFESFKLQVLHVIWGSKS